MHGLKAAEEAIASNVEGVMRDGPRLHTGLRSAGVARTATRILITGLGAMGVGTMWFDISDRNREEEGYDELPVFESEKDVYFNAFTGELVRRPNA